MTLALRYAVRSDVGLLAEGNEDSAYAGPHLLAVADGMGHDAAGAVASAATIATFSVLDVDQPSPDPLSDLANAVANVNMQLGDMIMSDPATDGMGTTLTALLWSDGHAALCHIGNSRAYLLRDGKFYQITHDHTLVQSLVDEGRITEDDAATHPQRSLLLRALDGRTLADPDLSTHEAIAGDRYLLCSDGLTGVVTEQTVHQVLSSVRELDKAALRLVELALKGGGPDNITCIVADVVDSQAARRFPSQIPVLAGAAQAGPPQQLRSAARQNSPAGRAGRLRKTQPQLPPPLRDRTRRRLVSVSVGRSRGASSTTATPGALPFAAERSLELGAALASLGYEDWDPTVDTGTARELGRQVEAAMAGAEADDLLVVHVLSHGMVSKTGALYVVGADGKAHALTDVEHWLKAVEDFPGRPSTLFLLDLCHGGIAARLPWQFARADGKNRAWVLAASQPDRQAFDGRFTQAAATVLGRLRRGELDIDRSVRYAPLATVAREIRREVDALATASGGYPQQVTCSVVDLATPVEVPFFLNPGFREDERNQVRGRIDTALAPFLDDLDDIFDPRHFISRAAGHGPMADRLGTGCFSGRRNELIALTAWLNQDEDGPVRLVTGSAGVGKSALIGVLVCAAHPVLRRPTRLLWEQVERTPGQVPHMAAAHARQRSLAEVTQALASQLGFGDCATAEDLIIKVSQSPTRPLLVLDALDEALAPAALMDQLLLPLISAKSAAGDPACRLLVGVRDEPGYARLRAAAEANHGLVDLNQVDDNRLRDDLDEYIGKLLRAQPPYNERGYAGARATFAAAVAETLVSSRAGRRWGEFLVAALYTHHLLTGYEPIASPTEAERLGLQVPAALPEVLELDLRSRHDVPFLRPVLATLAHALGEGMPASLVRAVVPVFTNEVLATTDQVSRALNAARFYLRHTVDTDGTAIYRLFHQGLADYLRQHPVSADAPAPGDTTSGVLSSLLGSLPLAKESATEARQWNLAEPYLLRHALQHAEISGGHYRLLSDTEFLVHADPAVVAPTIDSLDTMLASNPLSIYRATSDQLADKAHGERRQMLALSALNWRQQELARRFTRPPGQPSALAWEPVWREPNLPTQLRLGAPVTDAIVVDFPSGPAAVYLTRTGSVVRLSLRTGEHLGEWPASAGRTSLTELRVGGQPALLARSGHEASICVDPAVGADFVSAARYRDQDGGLIGHPMPAEREHPSTRRSSIVQGRVIRLDLLIPGGASWVMVDPATGEVVASLASPPHGSSFTSARTLTVEGRPFFAAGTSQGTLSLWDLTTGKLRDMLYLDGKIEEIIPTDYHHLLVIADGILVAFRHNSA